jgi:PadR family transcriptional regulator, regulatory protein PadR
VTRTRRPSSQTVAVLRTLAEDPGRWRYGYDLCAELGIQAGSMYPILMRLADRGLLETSWEAEPAPGKPPRHLYRLTGAGRAYAAATTAATATAATAAATAAASTVAASPPPGVSPVRTAAPPRPRLEGA